MCGRYEEPRPVTVEDVSRLRKGIANALWITAAAIMVAWWVCLWAGWATP